MKIIKTGLAALGVLMLPSLVVIMSWYSRGTVFALCVVAMAVIAIAFVAGGVWLAKTYPRR